MWQALLHLLKMLSIWLGGKQVMSQLEKSLDKGKNVLKSYKKKETKQ
jgi:hypothetical protein